MNEELEKLQHIGIQKIYDDTHIPIKYIQDILSSSFDGFSKVQLLGFVSILEREYSCDLTSIKETALKDFTQDEGLLVSHVFIAPTQKKKSKSLYVFIVILIFIIAIVYTVNVFNEKNFSNKLVLDNSMIENVQESIKKDTIEVIEVNTTVVDTNKSSVELNQTVVIQEPITSIIKIEKDINKSFKVVTQSKVWMGYIDLKTNKKHQKTFNGEFELDPNKDWLLMFGHAYIDMYINGEIQKFPSRINVRFVYKDGNFKTIDADEFKLLNRGSAW